MKITERQHSHAQTGLSSKAVTDIILMESSLTNCKDEVIENNVFHNISLELVKQFLKQSPKKMITILWLFCQMISSLKR